MTQSRNTVFYASASPYFFYFSPNWWTVFTLHFNSFLLSFYWFTARSILIRCIFYSKSVVVAFNSRFCKTFPHTTIEIDELSQTWTLYWWVTCFILFRIVEDTFLYSFTPSYFFKNIKAIEKYSEYCFTFKTFSDKIYIPFGFLQITIKVYFYKI